MPRLIYVLFTLIAIHLISASAGHIGRRSTQGRCKEKLKRRAWHTLSADEKLAYIQAELCLMSTSAKTFKDVPGVFTRWDELQFLHITLANTIHAVGGFLPWHRLFVSTHEYFLKTDCNYTAGHPYWDEQLDVMSPIQTAAIFDPATGFGGDGSGSLGCVIDGPFAGLVLHLSGYGLEDYCLSRGFNQSFFGMANSTYVNECMARPNYADAWYCWYSSPHTAGHKGVGGTVGDVVKSPGDPIFYVHHANVDRLWWEWQQIDLQSRLYDIAGQNTPAPFDMALNNFPPVSAATIASNGDPGTETTMSHVLDMMGLVPNRTIAEVMDIRSDLLCYEYI